MLHEHRMWELKMWWIVVEREPSLLDKPWRPPTGILVLMSYNWLKANKVNTKIRYKRIHRMNFQYELWRFKYLQFATKTSKEDLRQTKDLLMPLVPIYLRGIIWRKHFSMRLYTFIQCMKWVAWRKKGQKRYRQDGTLVKFGKEIEPLLGQEIEWAPSDDKNFVKQVKVPRVSELSRTHFPMLEHWKKWIVGHVKHTFGTFFLHWRALILKTYGV